MAVKRSLPVLTAAAAALLAAGAYAPSLWNDFVNWDDGLYVYDNPFIRRLDGRFFGWAFTTFRASNWHPLTWISHALDYTLWGLNPLGHHLTSVVLHAVNVFLVVLLAFRLIEAGRERMSSGAPSLPDGQGGLIAAGMTGLLFGIHPLHVESVAWVSERKDLLCALFFLLSILSYTLPERTSAESGASGGGGARPFGRHYLLSLIFFLLALLSKPMAVSLPLVLLVLDWYPYGRLTSRRKLARAIKDKLSFLALALAVSVLTYFAQQSGGAVSSLREVPAMTRLLVAAQAIVTYLAKMVVPAGLQPFYSYPKALHLLDWRPLLSLAALIALTAACLALAKRQRAVTAAWIYYLLTLVPVIGIVQVGSQSMADRYTYLPSIGPFLLIGLVTGEAWTRAGMQAVRKPLRAVLGTSLAVLFASLLAAATMRQAAVWNNSIDFWSAVISRDPEQASFAYMNRGEAYKDKGQLELAMTDFDRAIALDPFFPEAYNSRGAACRKTGRIEQAIADYTRAVSLDPSFAAAYNNRGIALMSAGRTGEAIADFNRALELVPSYAQGLNNRGKAFSAEGMTDRAIADFSAALAADPWNADAYENRGAVFGRTGRLDRAVEDFTAAISLEPSRAELFYNRGLALAGSGRLDQALSDYDRAIAMEPQEAGFYLVRGEGHLKAGRLEPASRDFQKACDLGSTDGCAALHRVGIPGQGRSR